MTWELVEVGMRSTFLIRLGSRRSLLGLHQEKIYSVSRASDARDAHDVFCQLGTLLFGHLSPWVPCPDSCLPSPLPESPSPDAHGYPLSPSAPSCICVSQSMTLSCVSRSHTSKLVSWRHILKLVSWRHILKLVSWSHISNLVSWYLFYTLRLP